MDEKCSLRAFSEPATLEKAKAATSKREMDAKANSRARVICSPSYERRQIVNGNGARRMEKLGVMLGLSTTDDQELAGEPAE
jgi:hypothetical protein